MPKRMSESKYVRAAEAARLLGVTVRTIWNWVYTKKDEGFPQPIRVTRNVTVFPRDEIIAFAESKRVA